MTQEKKDNKSARREPCIDKKMVAIGKAFKELAYKHGALMHAVSGERIKPEVYKMQMAEVRNAYIDQTLNAVDLAVKRKWMPSSTIVVLLIQRYFPTSEGPNGSGSLNGKNGTPLLPVG